MDPVCSGNNTEGVKKQSVFLDVPLNPYILWMFPFSREFQDPRHSEKDVWRKERRDFMCDLYAMPFVPLRLQLSTCKDPESANEKTVPLSFRSCQASWEPGIACLFYFYFFLNNTMFYCYIFPGEDHYAISLIVGNEGSVCLWYIILQVPPCPALVSDSVFQAWSWLQFYEKPREEAPREKGRMESGQEGRGACVAEVLEWGHLCPEEGERAMGRFEPTKVGWP